MKASGAKTLNCWQFRRCGYGPDSPEPCLAASDAASDGVNGGANGGRLCWSVSGTLSGSEDLAVCAQETNCLDCEFFHLVKSEEGGAFQLLKLARGVNNLAELQRTITQVESLMAIHERLRSRFDLKATIREITDEARKITGARRCLVLLLMGTPPALQGEFDLRGETRLVRIDVDDKSAVGYAALHNQIVNLRDIYGGRQPAGVPVFNPAFDKQCVCRTRSFIAVPVCDSEDRVIGVITSANARKGHFSSDDEWFMEKYATEVALAVEKEKFVQQSVSALRLASIGETIAGLSHCIKNIAQALRTGSHVIKRAIQTDRVQDVKAAWDILDRHIERLADLSMDVLAYDPELRDRSKGGGLNRLVEHVVNLFREEAHARAIEIKLRRGRDLDSAKFKPRAIYRCLVNLISNALDACPLSEGVVRVATRRTKENEFMISVADNGRGMDSETIAAVFELFRTSKPGRGTGLGLATVDDIVKRYHGRVEIASRVGRGTTIRMFIREDLAVV